MKIGPKNAFIVAFETVLSQGFVTRQELSSWRHAATFSRNTRRHTIRFQSTNRSREIVIEVHEDVRRCEDGNGLTASVEIMKVMTDGKDRTPAPTDRFGEAHYRATQTQTGTIAARNVLRRAA